MEKSEIETEKKKTNEKESTCLLESECVRKKEREREINSVCVYI